MHFVFMALKSHIDVMTVLSLLVNDELLYELFFGGVTSCVQLPKPTSNGRATNLPRASMEALQVVVLFVNC